MSKRATLDALIVSTFNSTNPAFYRELMASFKEMNDPKLLKKATRDRVIAALTMAGVKIPENFFKTPKKPRVRKEIETASGLELGKRGFLFRGDVSSLIASVHEQGTQFDVVIADDGTIHLSARAPEVEVVDE